MRDHEGVEWLTVAQAAERFRIRGRRWVRMPDVMAAEHATRGAYVAQRGGRVQ